MSISGYGCLKHGKLGCSICLGSPPPKTDAERIAELEKKLEFAGAVEAGDNALINDLRAENQRLRELVADAIEDSDEFETEWNKAAKAALEGGD